MNKFFLILLSLLYNSLTCKSQEWLWQNPPPQGNSLTGVEYINENNWFVCGVGGSVMKTSNCGVTWKLWASLKTKTVCESQVADHPK